MKPETIESFLTVFVKDDVKLIFDKVFESKWAYELESKPSWVFVSWKDKKYFGGISLKKEFDGYGVLIEENGSMYDGYFKEGEKNGKGRYIL